jgi:hypothetical protein
MSFSHVESAKISKFHILRRALLNWKSEELIFSVAMGKPAQIPNERQQD